MVTASLPLVLAFLTQLSEHVRPGPCVIAKRPVPTVEAVALAAPLKHRIQEYRSKWRALCVGAPDRPGLETLLGEAIAIADELNDEKPPAAVLESLISFEGGELPGLGPGTTGVHTLR